MRRSRLLSLFLAAPLLVACGADSETARDAPGPDARELVLTRADGSTHTFPEPMAACRESEYDSEAKVLWILAGEFARRSEEPILYLNLGEGGVGPTKLDLPTVGSEENDGVFVGDGRDELSSAQEGATGTVEVAEASCEVGERVRLSLDVHLTSEFHGDGEVDVRGGIDVELGEMDGVLSDAG